MIPLKRLICLLMCLLFLPLGAHGDVLPSLYKATLSRDTRMRVTPEDTSRTLPLAKEGEQVLVHLWAEDWCLCTYEGAVGYLPTERLFEYIALADAPLPRWQKLSGLARMTAPAHVTVAEYEGNDLAAGDVIALIDESGAMTMHRDTTSLPAGSFAYVPFADPGTAEAGEVLYACTTWYNDLTGGALAAGRQHNIELAAQRLHGTVLSPGETFSYNALCAPYDAANGYVKAPNISISGVGVAGGVCQVSTTLFGAILGLDLDIGEFHVHRASGVVYAPLNFDCAVASFRDFTFTNTLDIPIRIEVLTQRGALTVLLICHESSL